MHFQTQLNVHLIRYINRFGFQILDHFEKQNTYTHIDEELPDEEKASEHFGN